MDEAAESRLDRLERELREARSTIETLQQRVELLSMQNSADARRVHNVLDACGALDDANAVVSSHAALARRMSQVRDVLQTYAPDDDVERLARLSAAVIADHAMRTK